MDVRAVILVGSGHGDTERFAGTPIALLDVLGRSVLDRVTDHLEQQGVSAISVVGELSERVATGRRPNVSYIYADPPWRAAETAFNEQAQAGAELILVIRLGAYVELNIERFIQFHLDNTARVTALVDRVGNSLDHFAISASRRNDAAYLLRSELKQFRSGCVQFPFSGYINRLRSAAGLRQMVIDAFSGDNQIAPCGEQIKPGVWVGEGARIQRGARLLAPCFIGANAKIRAHAVIARCSTVERDACVDFGTVVENSSILPYANVGAGLDMMHSVIGFRRVAHLVRHTEVEIADPKLVNAVSSAPHLRALGHAISLATFLPKQLVKGMMNGQRPKPATLTQAVRSPSSALKQTATPEQNGSGEEFQAPFIVARR
jgi:NDP-sugar pyrophosphorylase family protein